MKFKILTIFPEFFDKALDFSLIKKARNSGVISTEIYDLRDWAKPRTVHKMVDDRPYGGGPGMVMMVEPVYRALKELKFKEQRTENKEQKARFTTSLLKAPSIKSQITNGEAGVWETPPLKGGWGDVESGGNSKSKIRNPKSKIIIFSPKGQRYDQVLAEKLAAECDELILICPHYEGFDERILNFVDYEISIGDYILTGGEIPALVVIDSVARLIPGVVGNEESTKTESFSKLKEGERNLEYPQYTRPEVFIDDEGAKYKVPEVLLSGNHREIEKWREAKNN